MSMGQVNYRRKPEVVKAIQYNWSERTMWIGTRDGVRDLWPGDWCLTHSDGKVSVVKAEVFKREYELVEDRVRGVSFEGVLGLLREEE